MRNLDKKRINSYKEDHTFIKYFFKDEIEHSKSRFLNLFHNDELYMFSIERLTIRSFKGEDYKKNNNRNIFNNSSFRIGLYLDGESEIYIDNKLSKVDTSTIFLQSPGPQISLTPKISSNCTVLEFYFDLTNSSKKQIDIGFVDYLNILFDLNIEEHSELNPINDDSRKELQDLFLNLLNYLLDYDRDRTDSIVNKVIFEIFYKISRILTKNKYINKNSILNDVILEIKQNYKKNYTIDELANIASLSRHYFQNLFKKTYGITPIEFLNKTRIKHAKFMLKNYNYSCGEISYNLGFSSPLYFSKVFKKYTGLSPTKYRSNIEHEIDS